MQHFNHNDMKVQDWDFTDFGFVTRDSSVSIATDYGLDDQGEREFKSW
jgi:hypothetical protein